MHAPSTLCTLLVAGLLLAGCSGDDDDDEPVITVDGGGLPTDTPGTDGGPAGGACAIPPDLQTGDSIAYRYTDATGTTMDVSLDVASTDGSAIVMDVTEGDSVYRAAVSTFCNDTPELDLPGAPDAALQPLFDQYASRPLLREIVQPDFGRFEDGTEQDLDADVQDDCTEGETSVPALAAEPVATYECTFTYDADIAGSTVTVDTVTAQTRRDVSDFGRLVEKVQTAPDGTVQSLVLVSFDPAG